MSNESDDAYLDLNSDPKTQASDSNTRFNSAGTDFSDAISLFQTLIQNQFQSLEKKFEDRVSANAHQLKKQFTESAYDKLKGEGNKIQFKFNLDILDDLDQVLKLIDKNFGAETLLLKIIEKLRVRNKHIRIADASPAGWRTVSEYQTNEIADDSDDEKKIRSAEQRAIKIKKANSANRYNPYRSGSNIVSAAAGSPAQLQSTQFPFPGARGHFNQSFRGYTNKRNRPLPTDLCFKCFQPGHWQIRCPLNATQGASHPTTQPATK